MTDYIYDTECYPNVWTCGLLNTSTFERHSFEISHRRNDAVALSNFIYDLVRGHEYNRWGYAPTENKLVGYNNNGYDYPILHQLLKNPLVTTCESLYEKSQAIFASESRFAHTLWESDHIITQIDLYLIHHFDNKNKGVRLKDIEFNLRMENIIDLPFEPGTTLSDEEIDHLIKYQFNDIEATYQFYLKSLKAIKTREYLSKKYNKNMLNYNDTKIGKNRFIDMLEQTSPGICYDRSSGKRVPRQTHRESIAIKDVIFPYIKFNHPDLQRLHKSLWNETIRNLDAGFKDAKATVKGLEYKFGMGGLHACIPPCVITDTQTRMIIDVDVESYYPSVMIANRLYPQHLSELFCIIFAGLKEERKKHAKGTPENAMYKLALNGTFGATNDYFSPFFDQRTLLQTTLNGQLLLAMLAEKLSAINGLEIIQINTDGLTFAIDRIFAPLAMQVCQEWERFTCLKLERNDYAKMAIRDVNNYIAVDTEGKIKRKGCYDYHKEWHQDHSNTIVARAAEAALIYDLDYKSFIKDPQRDMLDFMGKAKVPRSSIMYSHYCGTDKKEQSVTRYYIANRGVSLIKSMPPLPKVLRENPNAPRRRIGIAPTTDWNCLVANKLPSEEQFRNTVNYLFYIMEAEKIISPLTKTSI